MKMASAETPHYELYDEEKDIIIYGIKIEALFPEGFGITSQGVDIVHQIIPDVVEKCQNSSYGKKSNSSVQCWSLGSFSDEVIYISLTT